MQNGFSNAWKCIIHNLSSANISHWCILLLTLQSRARQEDPEQLRLKQKAKEVGWEEEEEEDSKWVPISVCVYAPCAWFLSWYVCVVQMQQQELAQMRQREANLTALAAIGPRKKRKILDSPSSSAAAEVTLIKVKSTSTIHVIYPGVAVKFNPCHKVTV